MIFSIFALVMAGAVSLGASQAYAQSALTPSLVQTISEKFGLNHSEIQAVFDSYKLQRQADRQQRLKLKLDQEVSQGKLTTSQEQTLLGELDALKLKYSVSYFKSMTPAARRQAMKDRRSELKSWAQSQGINSRD